MPGVYALLGAYLETKTMRWMVALLIEGLRGFNPHWLHSQPSQADSKLLKPGGSSSSSYEVLTLTDSDSSSNQEETTQALDELSHWTFAVLNNSAGCSITY